MPEKTSETVTEVFQGLEGRWVNLGVAALLFGVAIALSHFPSPGAQTVGQFVALNNFWEQFVAGLFWIVTFILAFARGRFSTIFGGILGDLKPLAAGGLLFMAGQFFLGLAQSYIVTAPLEGAILYVLGGALILISIVFGGTLGQKLSAKA